MKWSPRVARLFGIDVFVHWTFLALVLWIAHLEYDPSAAASQNAARIALGLLFMASVFGCILLHELGHALMARRFGIRTRDIVLLPIGGVARLEASVQRPMQELLISLAGPAVNVVIAGALMPLVVLSVGLSNALNLDLVAGHFAANLLWVNVVLVVFNMVPAFPMDGGRVLRAVLAMRLDYVRATTVAARIGQVLAAGFALVGLLVRQDPFLVLLAVFVASGAQAELRGAKLRRLGGLTAGELADRSFRHVDAGETVRDALARLGDVAQDELPVFSGDAVVGFLSKRELFESAAKLPVTAVVGEIPRRRIPVVPADLPAAAAAEILMRSGRSAIPVVAGDRLTGLLTAAAVKKRMGASS